MDTAKLQTKLGTNFISLVRYEMGTKYALVLKHIDAGDIKAVREALPTTSKEVLMLREKDIKDGLDVFALDLLHIKTDYSLIEGKDIFKSLKLAKKDVREQLEFTLRSKLIVLRQRLLYAKSDRHVIDNAPMTLLPILKGLLYIKGKSIETAPAALIEDITKCCTFDTSVLAKIFNDKTDRQTTAELLQWMTSICDEVDAIIAGK